MAVLKTTITGTTLKLIETPKKQIFPIVLYVLIICCLVLWPTMMILKCFINEKGAELG